jgi:hypothetical protein
MFSRGVEKMKKKIGIVWLGTAILLSLLAGGGEIVRATAGLTDIQTHWARDTIQPLVLQGIIHGYADGTFRPDDSINRDEYVKLVVVALGYHPGNGASYWAQPYVDKALELGLFAREDYDAFNTPISREEMTSIIVKAAALTAEVPVYEYDYTIPDHISDYGLIAEKYRDAVVDSYRFGLITGKSIGTFAPTSNSTRAEAATVISRLLDVGKRNTYQEYVEGHPAITTENITAIYEPGIIPTFYEMFKERKDIKAYGSVDELRNRLKYARDFAESIEVEIDEEDQVVRVNVPEYDEKELHFRIASTSGQVFKHGIFEYPFSEITAKGVIIQIIISEFNAKYHGAWVYYNAYAYIHEGQCRFDEEWIAKPLINYETKAIEKP